MKELVHIAQNVVKAVSKDIPFDISLSDKDGYIVGATDPKRIGTFHPVSNEVIKRKNFISFTESDVSNLENVLPGIAVPLNFNNETIGVLGMIGPPDDVKPHAEFTKRYVELMWRETYYRQVKDLEDKIKETNLQYILLNETKNPSRLSLSAELLDLKIHGMCFCIVIHLGDFLLEKLELNEYAYTVNHLKQSLLREVEHIFKDKNTCTINFIDPENIIVLQQATSINDYFSYMKSFKNKGKKLIHEFQNYSITEVTVSAGQLCTSLKTIHESYQGANDLIQSKHLFNDQSVVSYFDWSVLNDLLPMKLDEKFKDMIVFRLQQLIDDNQFGELKSSFIAYCENGMNISEAAKSLFVHRNTLIYRLKKIEKLLSFEIRNFQHCALLYFILKKL